MVGFNFTLQKMASEMVKPKSMSLGARTRSKNPSYRKKGMLMSNNPRHTKKGNVHKDIDDCEEKVNPTQTMEARSEDAVGQQPRSQPSCVLCCEEIEVFAVGPCDHTDSVCYKCSSRMRALCKQNYCAVCRADIEEVVFCREPLPFKDLFKKNLPHTKKFSIYFQDHKLRAKFNELLDYVCPVCEKTLYSTDQLRKHVRREHDKQYCDICVEHLQLFPREYCVYSRSEMVLHRKEGDADNRSYRGHPLCEFCSERYFDNDDLLVHLRKNHFWCHFCESDGKQDYYADYSDLQDHFRSDHFLCEEGDCVHEKFTSAFRNKLDLQAHKIAKHSKQLSKQEARQARSIAVDIDYGTRRSKRPGVVSGRDYDEVNNRERKRYSERRNELRRSPDNGLDVALASSLSLQPQPSTQPQTDMQMKPDKPDKPESYKRYEDDTEISKPVEINTNSESDFSKPSYMQEECTPAITKEEFPTLALATTTVSSGQASGKGIDKYADSLKQSEVQGKQEKQKQKGSWANASGGAVNISCEESFPALGTSHGRNPKPKKAPPGFNRVAQSNVSNPVKSKMPPGFASIVTKSKVPPGLRKDNVVEPNCAIPDKLKLDAQVRKEVKGTPGTIDSKINLSIQERNIRLVKLISSLLDEQEFDKFKDISGKYRRGEMVAASYYDEINSLLGNNFQTVFQELTDLLPDLEKQKDLLRVHQEKTKTEEIKEDPKPKEFAQSSIKESPKPQKKKKGGMTGSQCGLVIPKKEAIKHLNTHSDTDFPALPVAKQKPTFGAVKPIAPARSVWVKGK